LPAVRTLFSVTAFLGAALLFLVEPMFARMVLPLLGGAPAVWNTCLVFYQVALLGGYFYAHIAGTRLSGRQQVLLHAVLLLAAGLMLPIAVRGGAAPPPFTNPIGWVFQLLIVSLGLPFFALATTGPLLQRWFASLPRESAGDPYWLFAASNVGSFVALLGYPFLVEPTLRLRTQSLGWTAAYVAFAVLMLSCGMAVWRHGRFSVTQPAVAPPVPVPARSAKPTRARRGRDEPQPDAGIDTVDGGTRLRWLGLAAVPSTLMMSVTTFISMDVAAVPLLWVVPLALYLLTFVLAFAERQIVPRRLIAALFPAAVVLIVGLVLAPPVFPAIAIVLHLAAFFVVALACHTELSGARPPTEGLTEYYLWLSAGGAIGGLFNALVAPLIFVNPFEYPLGAISSVLLLPGAAGEPQGGTSRIRAVAGAAMTLVPVALVVALLLAVQRFNASLPADVFTRYAIIFVVPCLAAFAMRKTPLRMGLALALVAVAGSFIRYDNRLPLHVERSFFGVHRVMFTGRERLMLSGTTNHGVQSVDPSLRCEPLSYYSRGGPVGQILDGLPGDARTRRIGVVGLGTASMAAYAQTGQRWTFYEINPVVERLARDPQFFTYLRDCAPNARVVTGDARLMLAREPDGAFDLLVLDAFSSDAIPVHLMTVEAMQLYFSKLSANGVVALHISNRFMRLAPVVASVARRAGYVGLTQLHVPTSEQRTISAEIVPSRWAVVARRPGDLGSLATDRRWQSLDDFEGPVWTDDYSNVIGAMQR
jgi:hypothetical protein